MSRVRRSFGGFAKGHNVDESELAAMTKSTFRGLNTLQASYLQPSFYHVPSPSEVVQRMYEKTVTTDSLDIRIPKKTLELVAEKLVEYYEQERGTKYPVPVVLRAMSAWLTGRINALTADMEELLTSPGRSEAIEFRRLLEKAFAKQDAIGPQPITSEQEATIFNGNRAFSIEKMRAMIAYIGGNGKEIYKTKLNKLLFYSDFVNYYLFGHSISGARYIHFPYGPVPDGYDNVLNDLSASGAIQVVKGETFELIKGGNEPLSQLATKLSENERTTLDWVLKNFGNLSANEISELSHNEKAYRFTRPGEEIAYEYAKFFERLPGK